MTGLLILLLVALAALGLYLASRVARAGGGPRAFLDGGPSGIAPGLAIFATGAVALAGSDPFGLIRLTAVYGLQASHMALGLILAALAWLLIQKRLWLAARISGWSTPGEALARYYGSVTLRLATLTVTAIFALPFAADHLARAADFLAQVSQGDIPREAAIWGLGFGLFLPAVVGGWRAMLLAVAVEALLMVALIASTAGLAEIMLPGPGFVAGGLHLAPGILSDAIPGVVQYSAGIGKGGVAGGLYTTVTLLTGALSLVGLVLSPAFLALGMTMRPGRSTGFSAVWVVAGLIAGLLALLAPILAARAGGDLAALVTGLSDIDRLAGAAAAVGSILPDLLAAGFFATCGTLLISRELVLPFFLPGLTPAKDRLAARIALALAFALIAALATFSPLAAAIFSSLALPLSVQLLPALLGLAYVPWISRSAVLTGLILGALAVFFTEPPGLILFEGLFLDLPWGRWPLTVHSAGWGLGLNLAAVLLAAIFTRKGAERLSRDRLHGEFAAEWRTPWGGKAARAAKWSLVLIWAFFALGPGAILGNGFFSQPVFAEGPATLGLPSLWVWQILFWLIGVPLVWWLAYGTGLGITSARAPRRLVPDESAELGRRSRAPDWIAAGLARITER